MEATSSWARHGSGHVGHGPTNAHVISQSCPMLILVNMDIYIYIYVCRDSLYILYKFHINSTTLTNISEHPARTLQDDMDGKINAAEKDIEDAQTAFEVHAEGLKVAIRDNHYILKIA